MVLEWWVATRGGLSRGAIDPQAGLVMVCVGYSRAEMEGIGGRLLETCNGR